MKQARLADKLLMPDPDGLVIVHDNGGISVINLKRDTIKLSLGPQDVLTVKIRCMDFDRFIQSCSIEDEA